MNSTDRPTLHTLLPINLLKWISNAALGASTGLRSYHKHTPKQKHTIFISSLGLWGKRARETVEMSGISMEETANIVSFSHKLTGFVLKIVKRLLVLRCERDLVCNSGHLLSWLRNRCCILSQFDYWQMLQSENGASYCLPFLIFGSVLRVCCAGQGWLITWWTARWLRRPWAPVPTKTITKPVWPPTHGSSVSFFECLRENINVL